MNKAIFTEIEKTILANLKVATSSINIAVAWFKNPVFYNLILEKQKNGVNVQIILADDISNFTNSLLDFQEFINSNGSIKISRFPALMHHKFCIVDKRLLITGSYNWTLNAEHKNIENILLIKELGIIQAFEDEFMRLSKRTEGVVNIAKTSFYENQNTLTEANGNIIVQVNSTSPFENEMIESENIIPFEVDDETLYLLEEAEQLYCQAKYEAAINLVEKAIEKNPLFSDGYELLSRIKWRLKEYRKQIEFAQKAVEMDNLNYAAYNSLGIGYSKIGNSQKSIENYQICIVAEPNSYVYYWNRALSYQTLKGDAKFPSNLKTQFANKAKTDFEKVIELTDKAERKNENEYRLFQIRGGAKLSLNQVVSSKRDLEKGIELYKNSPKEAKDIHVLREMKASLKEVEQKIKSPIR